MDKRISTKKISMLLIIGITLTILFSLEAYADSVKPYLRNPELPEHPELKPKGIFKTNLFLGAATYSYPIDVPPGTNNLQPDLAMVYNHHLSKDYPSLLGAGWTLTQSYIQRNANFTFSDKENDRLKLFFEGQEYELIYVPSEDRFYTEIDKFMLVKNFTGGNNEKNEYWVVTTKDGTSYRFGFNNDSEMVSNLHDYVWRWSLDQINDTHDNNIYFEYEEDPTTNDIGSVYPKKIEYNNDRKRKIEFTLESNDRIDIWHTYDEGHKIKLARRIKEINVSANNKLVRKYVFDYDSIDTDTITVLEQIENFGNDDVSALPLTDFTYNDIQSGWDNTTGLSMPNDVTIALSDDGRDRGYRFMDINGDGLADIIRSYETGDISIPGGQKSVWINNGSGWTQNDSWNLPDHAYFAFENQGVDGGVRFANVNDDSLVDLIQSYDDGEASSPRDIFKGIWINNGSGWVNQTNETNLTLPDSVIFSKTTSGLDPGFRVADLNGDGLSDIIQSYSTPEIGQETDGTKNTWINNGSGWSQDNSWNMPHHAFFSATSAGSDGGVRFAEINNDGLIDVVQAHDNCYGLGNVITKDVWLNNGSGWINHSSNWTLPSAVFFALCDDGYDRGFRMTDLNGDGLSDIVESYSSSSISAGPNPSKNTWINNGSGWVLNSTWNMPYHAFFTKGNDGRSGGTLLVDVNGDGHTDVVQAYEKDSGLPLVSRRDIWVNNATKGFLLNNINNSMGGKTSIEYKKSTSLDNTGNDSISDINFNLWVVDNVSHYNGMNISHNVTATYIYNYSDGLYDYEREEFMGFGYATENRPDDSIVRHWFHQDLPRRSREYQTEFLNNSADIFKKTTKEWTFSEENNHFITLLSEAAEYSHDGKEADPKITNTTYAYDDYGNTIAINYFGDISISTDDRFESFEFLNNTDIWIVDRIKHYQLFDSDNSTLLKENWFSYDNLSYGTLPTKGDLTKKEDYLDTGSNPATRYNYDSYGNIIEEIDARNHSTSYSFGISDDTFTFPEKIVNAKSHAFAFTYDLGTGNKLSQTDANGFLTNYTYDVFSRISKEILPYDSESLPTVEYEYNLDGEAPENIKIKKRETSGEAGTLDTIHFYDGFGNLVQVKTEAETSKQIVNDHFYDGLNRVQKQSNPYFTATQDSYFTPNQTVTFNNFTYDAIGRIIQVVNPDNTSVNISFDHWNITLKDENSNRKDYLIDAYDQIIKVIEFENGNKYSTQYSYDPLGNIILITDSQGNTFSYTYDSLGRKIGSVDPDFGTWNYTYDAMSNILEQTDNRNNKLTMSYDEINRITQKNGSNKDITYTYDIKTNSTLSSVEFSGTTINYTYDDRLRKLSEKTILDGLVLPINFSYDAMDRITSRILPDGNAITYNYTEQGLLDSMSDIITNINYNEMNQPSKITYENSLDTDFTYDQENFRLKQMETVNRQNLNYDYDSVGNVLEINDTLNNRTDTMRYDDLDRLSFAERVDNSQQGDNEFSINYTYNSIGNMLSILFDQKNYTFSYGQTPAHSPSKITEMNISDLLLTGFGNLSVDDLDVIFEFQIINNIDISIPKINWSLDTGEEIVLSDTLINLKPDERMSTFVAYNYSSTGDYTAIASATNGTSSDSDSMIVDLPDVEVSSLSALDISGTAGIFEFDIENTLLPNLDAVSWNFDTKDSLIINSTSNIVLKSQEIASVYVAHNFSETGTYNVNATAINGSLADSLSTSVTI